MYIWTAFERETFVSEENVQPAQPVGYGYVKDGLQFATCPEEHP